MNSDKSTELVAACVGGDRKAQNTLYMKLKTDIGQCVQTSLQDQGGCRGCGGRIEADLKKADTKR